MFSIVIPCHENVELLKKVLAGLVTQNEKVPFEVILVDNDSREEDLNEVYKKYIDYIPLYLVKQPRLSHPMMPCKARNIGIMLAKYDWIINLDSDCIPNKNYLKYLRQHINANASNNMIITGTRIFIDSKKITDQDILSNEVQLETIEEIASSSNYFLKKDRRLLLADSMETCSHPWALIHTCNTIYRKDTAIKVGGFDEEFDGCWGYEDTDFAYRMIKEGKAKPYYLSEIDCYHQEPKSHDHEERFNKTNNRNWALIQKKIPGIEQFKKDFYKKINSSIKVD